MEVVGSEGHKALLAFTALRLEFGWTQAPMTSGKMLNLKPRWRQTKQLEVLKESLLN